jgi:hypothetical protein
MSPDSPRLLQLSQLADALQLEEAEVQWLVNTGQIQRISICGQHKIR